MPLQNWKQVRNLARLRQSYGRLAFQRPKYCLSGCALRNVMISFIFKGSRTVHHCLFLFRLATSCVQNTVGCHAINVPKSGPRPVSREIRKRCNKMWTDIGKKFIGELLQSSYKHVQMRQYCLIKQVCRSGVKFFTPGGSSDFICHASLIDWKILNLNCGEIYKGMHDHHSYIHNLNLREKRLLLLLKKKIKIEQDLKPWPLQ